MNVIELAKELVSIPSPLGDTRKVEEYLYSRLEKVKGADVEFVPVGSLGNNVLASVFRDGELPTILLNGHLDTVEVCNGWTMEPFEPREVGGRLYGLGSADMKSGVAIALDTFKKLAGTGKCNAMFAGTIDEEGNSAGAFTLLDKGIKADLCLIPEPSGGTLMMGCRGRVVFEASVRGTSAHGSRPEEGVNAITEAGRFVAGLDKLELAEDEKLGRGSFCPLEISGGTRTLSVPDSCLAKVDRHYVRGETKDSMLAHLIDSTANLKSRARFDISYWKERPTPFLEPYLTENIGLANDFARAIDRPFSYGKSVGDYNAFAKIMPTVVYGPTGTNWHGPDEWVDIASVNESVEGYGRFIERLRNRK